MKNITVYSGPMCNFCDAAKRLLTRNNLNYNEIDISTKEGLRDEMTKRANGRRTIPQIFFDDYHIGGYQELRELEKTGKTEGEVIKIMRRSLKPSSFRQWRKRASSQSIKHRKKFEYSRKQIKSKINKVRKYKWKEHPCFRTCSCN